MHGNVIPSHFSSPLTLNRARYDTDASVVDNNGQIDLLFPFQVNTYANVLKMSNTAPVPP